MSSLNNNFNVHFHATVHNIFPTVFSALLNIQVMQHTYTLLDALQKKVLPAPSKKEKVVGSILILKIYHLLQGRVKFVHNASAIAKQNKTVHNTLAA